MSDTHQKTFSQKIHRICMAANKNASRPLLSGVAFYDNGRVAATDSYILLELDNNLNGMENKEFPMTDFAEGGHFERYVRPKGEGEKEEPTCYDHYVLNAEKIKAMKPPSERGVDLPILSQMCRVKEDKDFVTMRYTDLDSTVDHKIRKIDGQFPNYEAIMPEYEDEQLIAVDPKLLIKVLTAMKDDYVAIVVPKLTPDPHTGKVGVASKKATLVVGMGSNCDMRGLIMPVLSSEQSVAENKLMKIKTVTTKTDE